MARNQDQAVRAVEPEREGNVPVRGPGGLGSLRSEMNRLFDRFGGRPANAVEDVRSPADLFDPFGWAFGGLEPALGRSDLSETDEGYELEVDLPGLKREDVAVDYANGTLTISGERSDEREDKRKGYYLSERSYGSVRRNFRAPESVKIEDIRAEFKDGVLSLIMPKTEEAQRSSRRIEVQ